MGGSVYFLFVLYLVLVGLVTEIGGSDFQPVLSGPNRAYLKSRVQFECQVSGLSSPPTYELRKDDGRLITTDVNTVLKFTVTEESEGKYYCRLNPGGQTSNTLQLQVVIPVQGVSLSSEPDPAVIYEGGSLVLRCLVKKGSYLSFRWYHNKQEVTSQSKLYQLSENTLTVERAGEQHAGIYSCMASNQIDDSPRFSSSQNLNVYVEQYISAPRLTFTVFSNGSDLIANISCRLDRGSPPVIFHMLLNGVEMFEKQVSSLETWFLLPVSVGLKMGAAQCKAKKEIQQLISDPVNLEVVPVGGTVQVVVTYLHDVTAVVTAARLKCVPSRGTFPSFSWTLNHTSLPSVGEFHGLGQHGQILVITDITAASSGYYRCAVKDSFDNNSTWVESSGILIQNTDLVVMPMEVMAFVFCGFLLMVIIGGTFCVLWNINRRIEKSHNNQVNQSGTIIDPGVTGAVDSHETQSIEMKTVVMEFESDS
ncbi:Fc receptor-like protein 5 isoform X2 [Misgurnus anguillicaudatus]|uniref:Fc receptor-like protein 5 isoform X2 n=1 Tax=Misgurnus anguillicaudatus TaxID=75329 RepID=UPI003CCF8C8C